MSGPDDRGAGRSERVNEASSASEVSVESVCGGKARLSTLLPRSYLYVPADRPHMLGRAFSRGADALVIDLEDAVAPQAKEAARKNLADWLAGLDRGVGDDSGLIERYAGEGRQRHGGRLPEIWVRVNAFGATGAAPLADLEVAVHPEVTGVVQAKCRSAQELGLLDEALARREEALGLEVGFTRVAALVESPNGVLGLRELASGPRVCRLQLGEVDLAASLGMAPGAVANELMPLRLALVLMSAAAGIDAPVGAVYLDLADEAGLRAWCGMFRRLGFSGLGALHPAQVPVINDAFSPSAEETAAARSIVARFDQAVAQGNGVALDDHGQMIDEAVVRASRAVLKRAERQPRTSGPGQEAGQASWRR